MRQAIAISILGVALVSGEAAAQTATETARILGDFQRSVVDYTQPQECLGFIPETLDAASPAPKVFTLPVAVVFRQLIANALARQGGAAMVGGVGAIHHPAVRQPFPLTESNDFPRVLADALPALPAPLEFRLIDRDLVIRDANAGVIVAVLRDAVGTSATRR